MGRKILVSAGEASGDLYAALVVTELRRLHPDAEFFGCTGPRLRAAGVRTVVDAASLAVVGLIEVVEHIPRIYGEYKKLLAAADAERPDVAILTDSPDFHLRIARKLHRKGIPVVYLVAPQAWAWRKGRIPQMRRTLRHLLCIFPFEEAFFRREGVTRYLYWTPNGGPGGAGAHQGRVFSETQIVPQPSISYGVAWEPSRRGGAASAGADGCGGPVVQGACGQPVVAGVGDCRGCILPGNAWASRPIQVIEGESWDAMAHADVALAASGTVTVEAALLGTPMVTF